MVNDTLPLNATTLSKPVGCRTANPDVFTLLIIKRNALETKQFFLCKGRYFKRVLNRPKLITEAETAWSNFFQRVLCFSYTTFLIRAWLHVGANVLKVAYQVVNLTIQDQKNTKGSLLLDIKSHNDTMSANCDCQTLQKLHTPIKDKCQGKLTDIIFLLCGSVHTHEAHKVQDQLSVMKWEVL